MVVLLLTVFTSLLRERERVYLVLGWKTVNSQALFLMPSFLAFVIKIKVNTNSEIDSRLFREMFYLNFALQKLSIFKVSLSHKIFKITN
jgi:hypothetical protein